MANRTDPLITALSGSDPQNLMEYLTRQRIYDSRFWKEECFGMTVEDVLEYATKLECIGGLPTRFLSLLLKLLQLHPETELVIEAFCEQDSFKYVRALGCLYVRMTGRPADIYQTLEACYSDFRKLRLWIAPKWSIIHMDEYIHQLLTSTHAATLTLPRLPSRGVLQMEGYLEDGPRPTALKDLLIEHGGPLALLKYKVEVEKSAAAIEAWKERNARLAKEEGNLDGTTKDTRDDSHKHADQRKMETDEPISSQEKKLTMNSEVDSEEPQRSSEGKDKRKKKKQRNYDNLFKTGSKKKSTITSSSSGEAPAIEGSDEYWNEQRAKLGLKPLNEN